MAVTTNAEIAARWAQGLTGDWSILEALTSPTMRVWHSHDGDWLTAEQGAARMADSGATATPPSFQDVRTIPTDSGFIVQGSIEGLMGSGKTHIVQVCTVLDGQIAVCEEYIAPEMNLGG